MKRWVFNVLIIFFSLVFLISGYFLLDYFLESHKQQGEFDRLAQMMDHSKISLEPVRPQQSDEDEVREDEETAPTEPELVTVTDPETGELVQVLPEFAELYTLNNDIVGWIYIPDTNVNYPVMQTPDRTDYYLYKNYEQEYSRHGCIYAREICDVFTPSDNVTIYGHRMGDGSMFNDLHKYIKEDFYDEHSLITFNTLTERHTYEIISIFRVASTVGHPFQYHQFVNAKDADHFNEFLANCQAYELYDTGVSAHYGDKLITLSTCEYSQTNGRLVVVAKRIT